MSATTPNEKIVAWVVPSEPDTVWVAKGDEQPERLTFAEARGLFAALRPVMEKIGEEQA